MNWEDLQHLKYTGSGAPITCPNIRYQDMEREMESGCWVFSSKTEKETNETSKKNDELNHMANLKWSLTGHPSLQIR